MADATTITEKINALIKATSAWKEQLTAVIKEQQEALGKTDALTKTVLSTIDQAGEAVLKLTNELISAGTAAQDTAARVAEANAQFKASSSGTMSAMDLSRISNVNPFAATDYISGASMLTTKEKAEFLRIVTDRDENALKALLEEFKTKIAEVYTDEYSQNKAKKDELNKKLEELGKKIEEETKSIQGKEGYSRSTIALIAKQRQEMSQISQKIGLLSQSIGQVDQKALRIQGQQSVLERAWSDSTLQKQLADTKENTGYTQEELLWLVNKALETGAGTKLDQVALTELINKLNNATPYQRYQLDLTVGDQKLSAFTDVSPEKFLEALLKARGTAIR